MAAQPTHLEPSQLGTKSYWDNLYERELQNNQSNPEDTGTVWFDDADAETRLLAYLEELTESATFDHDLRREDASFLDLGCGNGSLLFALRDDDWRGRLRGVDYSASSVALARRINEARRTDKTGSGTGSGTGEAQDKVEEQEAPPAPCEFDEWDVLNGVLEQVLDGPQREGWGVLLDKGTFDAVCLSSDVDAETGRRVSEGYRARVLKLLRPGGLFLVTSCNWTETELSSWFESIEGVDGSDGRLVSVGSVLYPSYEFGGQKGQAISTLCFQKR